MKNASINAGRMDPTPTAQKRLRGIPPVLLLVAATALSACGSDFAAEAREHASSAERGPSLENGEVPEVLATVGDEPVTLADIRTRVGSQLDQMEMQYLRARSSTIEGALETVLQERVLQAEARDRGMSIDELLGAEAGGALEPSDIEVEVWYQENRARLGGRSLEELRSQIADHLRDERRREVVTQLEARLFEERGVIIHFEPARVVLNNEGAPALGSGSAPVTLVEFSDFECPYCAQMAPTLKRLAETFGDDLQIVYRQFPIPSLHPGAFKAAEASLCAHEQGRFWDMHDLMFAEMSRLSVADLKEKARRIGLDGRRFDACLDSGRYVERVQNDMQEGSRVGVNGTPAIFVNGVRLEGGAVAYEMAAAAIRKELIRASR